MALDRTTLIQEFGLVVFNSQHFYSKGEILAELIPDTQDVESDAFGPVDKRHIDRRIEVKFTPTGQLSAGALSTLYPHGGLQIGESIYGSADTPLVIYTPSGKSLTIHNCAVTTMPTLTPAHDQTLFGEVTITGILKKEGDPSDANAYYTYVASGATYPGDANFNPANIKMLGTEGAWGATAPWDEIYTEAGWSFDFALNLTPRKADGHGTFDMTLDNIVATATALPLGISQNDVAAKMNFQGTGNALGASRPTGDDLIVTNMTGALALHVQLYGAILDESSALRFSRNTVGNGDLTWIATREFAEGVASPLFYVGVTAPA